MLDLVVASVRLTRVPSMEEAASTFSLRVLADDGVGYHKYAYPK
jgi:hypothetical protein